MELPPIWLRVPRDSPGPGGGRATTVPRKPHHEGHARSRSLADRPVINLTFSGDTPFSRILRAQSIIVDPPGICSRVSMIHLTSSLWRASRSASIASGIPSSSRRFSGSGAAPILLTSAGGSRHHHCLGQSQVLLAGDAASLLPAAPHVRRTIANRSPLP